MENTIKKLNKINRKIGSIKNKLERLRKKSSNNLFHKLFSNLENGLKKTAFNLISFNIFIPTAVLMCIIYPMKLFVDSGDLFTDIFFSFFISILIGCLVGIVLSCLFVEYLDDEYATSDKLRSKAFSKKLVKLNKKREKLIRELSMKLDNNEIDNINRTSLSELDKVKTIKNSYLYQDTVKQVHEIVNSKSSAIQKTAPLKDLQEVLGKIQQKILKDWLRFSDIEYYLELEYEMAIIFDLMAVNTKLSAINKLLEKDLKTEVKDTELLELISDLSENLNQKLENFNVLTRNAYELKEKEEVIEDTLSLENIKECLRL